MARVGETRAFRGSVKPAREGVYKRAVEGLSARWSYWDGERWHIQCESHQNAASMGVSGYQPDQNPAFFTWRGLAKKP